MTTWKEFSDALTLNGFDKPTYTQYHALIKEKGAAGGIDSKQELAMFLAQIIHESGGLKCKEELARNCPCGYDTSVGRPGKCYHGRGYIQLTHSYNYKNASYDLYGDSRLIDEPEQVANDERVALTTALWFWRTQVRNKPGVLDFYFGASTRAINGDLECDKYLQGQVVSGRHKDRAVKRFEIYKNVLTAFNLKARPIEKGCYQCSE